MNAFALARTSIAIAAAVALAPLPAAGQAESQAEAILTRARQIADDHPRRAMARYRQLLTVHPNHRQAYRELLALAREHGVHTSPDLLDQLGEEFPSGTHLRTTRHFMIVYDMPHAWADTRARLLEQVHDAFYRQMADAGFQPWPLHERLAAVLFARHEDYLAYADQLGATAMHNSSGFYASRANRIVFFSTRSHPELREQGRQLEQLQRQANQVEQELARAQRRRDQNRLRHLRTRRIQIGRQLTHARNQLNAAIGYGDITQTAHEAAHLLAFNSGIQNRTRPYPLWLSEGLATSFETINPATPFGPRHDNPMRRRALLQAADANQLLPLRDLLRIRSMADIPDGRATTVYAQAWGLFHYLWNHRLDELRSYMQAIASGRINAATDDQRLATFQTAFGNIDRVEQAWRAWMRQLRQ